MQAYTADYPQHHLPHHPHHQPYFTQDGSQNFANGFSRGSSFAYPHQDYRYFVDRGELASRLCSSGLVDTNSLDATGIGFAGNLSSGNTFVVPEDISVWDWSQQQQTVAVAPAPVAVYPQPPASAFKSSTVVCSPTAQLPTPAAMAVLLNPNAQLDGGGDQQQQQQQQQTDYEIPQGHMARAVRPVEPVVAVQGVPDSPSREKKHACTMCHKRCFYFIFFFHHNKTDHPVRTVLTVQVP